MQVDCHYYNVTKYCIVLYVYCGPIRERKYHYILFSGSGREIIVGNCPDKTSLMCETNSCSQEDDSDACGITGQICCPNNCDSYQCTDTDHRKYIMGKPSF